MNNLWQDLRYSVRMLAKSPVFTMVAVGSLSLGIGANTAIFSLMNAVMLRSLPVEEPGKLVLFGDAKAAGSTDSLPNESWGLFSYPFYRTFSQKTEVFSGVTAINSIEFATHGSLAGEGREMLHATLVSGTYFSVLGVNPDRGRVLNDSDDNVPGNGTVAVASYSWWQRHGGKGSAHRRNGLHHCRRGPAWVLWYHGWPVAGFLDSALDGKGNLAWLEWAHR